MVKFKDLTEHYKPDQVAILVNRRKAQGWFETDEEFPDDPDLTRYWVQVKKKCSLQTIKGEKLTLDAHAQVTEANAGALLSSNDLGSPVRPSIPRHVLRSHSPKRRTVDLGIPGVRQNGNSSHSPAPVSNPPEAPAGSRDFDGLCSHNGWVDFHHERCWEQGFLETNGNAYDPGRLSWHVPRLPSSA